MSTRIYLDNNASTSLDPRVSEQLAQILPFLQGNPSSQHHDGQKARSLINKSRNVIASFLAVKPQEIVFTSGGTECANLLIRGLIGNTKGHLITSLGEHSAVYGLAKQLETQGTAVSFLSPGRWGAIQPETVEAAIRADTKLIALMAVNNETGVMTNIEAIGAIAQKYGIPFFVDAVALMGKERFAIPPGVSAMGFSGHKFHALQGTGFAYLKSGIKISSLYGGGEQEFGRRSGTENVLGIISMAKAIELIAAEFPEASERMRQLRDHFERTLIKELGGISINGEGPRVANVSNLSFSQIDGETLLLKLDQEGISASHGSACSSGALEPSRVLLQMGLPHDQVRSSIRFSLSRFTTQQEIEAACALIIRIVKQLRY